MKRRCSDATLGSSDVQMLCFGWVYRRFYTQTLRVASLSSEQFFLVYCQMSQLSLVFEDAAVRHG